MDDSMFIEIDADGLAWWHDEENDVQWFFSVEDETWYIMGDDEVVYWEDEENEVWYFYDEFEDEWFECEMEDEDFEEDTCYQCGCGNWVFIGDEI
jgi:hypothetical protein